MLFLFAARCPMYVCVRAHFDHFEESVTVILNYFNLGGPVSVSDIKCNWSHSCNQPENWMNMSSILHCYEMHYGT